MIETYQENHAKQMQEANKAFEQNYQAKNAHIIQEIKENKRQQATIIVENNRAKSYEQNLNDKIKELNQQDITIKNISINKKCGMTVLLIEKNQNQK